MFICPKYMYKNVDVFFKSIFARSLCLKKWILEMCIIQLIRCMSSSGEHLFQIYRRLIGRSYIALARQDKIYRNISDALGRLRSDKRYFQDFQLISVLEVGFYFFHKSFGIRMLSPIHQATYTIPIYNPSCPTHVYIVACRSIPTSPGVFVFGVIIYIIYEVLILKLG